jgi:spore maturation protein CgeB
MRFVFFGLSIASAWGSGHATTYRGLLRELHRRGHEVAFYEQRTPWYDANCDLPAADYCTIVRYDRWPPPGVGEAVRDADVVVLGSYAADGIAVADWLPGHTRALLAYYDIDTPVTLQQFREAGRAEYLEPRQLNHFDLVLSFAGGPALDELRAYGARRAEPCYCAVDAQLYRPVPPEDRFVCDLGYMGTYAPERQDLVEELFLAPARLGQERRFLLAGAAYPDPARAAWPPNVTYQQHVAPPDHGAFFSSSAWQVKVTRAPMRRLGWSPPVTVFEIAACGAPLISDRWPGFEAFFEPGSEALVADTREDVLAAFELPESRRRDVAAAGRARVLRSHTYVQRADHLEEVLRSLGLSGARPAPAATPVRERPANGPGPRPDGPNAPASLAPGAS